MIHYKFYQKNPSSHYVYIDMLVSDVNASNLHFQLPSWRPGRYELGNFAKNIKKVDFFNEKDEPLNYIKHSKDLWEVESKNTSQIKVTYSYYSAELNAGACFADDTQIYINPVHCCMYVEGRTNEEHQIELKIPDNFRIATSLHQKKNILIAKDYDELVDSPFIASAHLQTDFYEINKIKFHIHFNGECKPDWKLIKENFVSFTKKQVEFWDNVPFDEYHFLFQVLPHKFYHGVEHKKNTVIGIGPGYAICEGETYESVLGVSCHELFHAWNIKTLRPVEMLPYDYTKENYARTGYVYEGFTTYYGDKLLLSSNVFSLEQYFKTLEERLQKHFHNIGRFNLSVAASSWENWLDGYTPGAPYRKTSIYDEGNLIAFMLDVKILKATENKKCLRDVCVDLYNELAKKQKGYSEKDIIEFVNKISRKNFENFFNDYVYTPNDYEKPLLECFDYLGIELHKENAHHTCEKYFGFKEIENHHVAKVSMVEPFSPAWKAGLFINDEIIAVNGMVLKNNLSHWLHYFLDDEIILTVSSNEKLKSLKLEKDKKGKTFYHKPVLKFKAEINEQQKKNFEAWVKW